MHTSSSQSKLRLLSKYSLFVMYLAFNLLNANAQVDLQDTDLTFGYGQRDTLLPVTIDNSEIETRALNTLDQALQGATTGVYVANESGQPGEQGALYIRGFSFSDVGNPPLYIVDGTPVLDALTYLDPSDISSIQILKDATATVLYGADASNGVLLITTKRGDGNQELKIDFSAKGGITTRVGDGYELMNAQDYYGQVWRGFRAQGLDEGMLHEAAAQSAYDRSAYYIGDDPYDIAMPYSSYGQLSEEAQAVSGTDWRDAIYQMGSVQDYHFAVSNGGERGAFYAALGAYDEQGIVIGTDYKRYNVQLNGDVNLTSWLRLGTRNSFGFYETNTVSNGTALANPVHSAEVFNPTMPVYNTDGSYNWENTGAYDFNPVALADMDIYRTRSHSLNNQVYAQFTLPYELSFKTLFSSNRRNVDQRTYFNPNHGNGASVNGRLMTEETDYNKLFFSNTLSWDKSISSSRISVLFGQELINEMYNYNSGDYTNVGEPASLDAAEIVSKDGYEIDWHNESYFVQINYDLASKYFITANARTDASSLLLDSKQRYSIEWEWLLSQETFFDVEHVNHLSIRSSVGGGDFKEVSVTLEGTMFDRVNAICAFYSKEQNGTYSISTMPSRGYTSEKDSYMVLQNRGVEVSVNTSNTVRENFTWNTALSLTRNLNCVESIDPYYVGVQRLVEGKSLYQFYLREWAGVNPADGTPMWYTNAQADDIEGSDEPSSAYLDPLGSERQVSSDYRHAERIDAGSSLPTVYGSLTNQLSYKCFSLDLSFYYSLGNKVYNTEYAANMHDGNDAYKNLAKDASASWTTPGQMADVPRYSIDEYNDSNSASTRFLEDGDYLRLQYLTFSYALSEKLMKRTPFSRVNIYFTGENIWTLTKYKGFDPEVGLNGITNYNIPGNKRFVFGVNVTI